MTLKRLRGWKKLVEGFPWFEGEGKYPIVAYSEFMPPPRLGLRPYGAMDNGLFEESDLHGWHVSEIEEYQELRPGMENIARQVLSHLVKLGRGEPAPHISGHRQRNLENNPYWPPELAAYAGRLSHERYVIFLPLALSKTQDDKGRVRWTFFGSSEQGPERAFWKGFYSAPGEEIPEKSSRLFLLRILSKAYDEKAKTAAHLGKIGFRILPSGKNARFRYWNEDPLPSWTAPFVIDDSTSLEGVRYLLTFRPFEQLPDAAKQKYFEGKLALLPFPGSLVFWGTENYYHLAKQLPFAFQMPLLRLVGRHETPGFIRVPQSGWLHERKRNEPARIQEELLLNTYRRSNRWERVPRHEDATSKTDHAQKLTDVLFSTALDFLDLYNKPMARNSQIWTEETELVLDGPNANRGEIARAADAILRGGAFRYRFQFPAMRVGEYEVFWHRPLVACLSHRTGDAEVLHDGPSGYLTGYANDAADLGHPVELWPRVKLRKLYLAGLKTSNRSHDHYKHQTALNILRFLDCQRLLRKRRLPRSFARQLLRIPKEHSLDAWLHSLPGFVKEGIVNALEDRNVIRALPKPITYHKTATREFEIDFWNDMLTLSHGRYLTMDNADPVLDPVTQKSLLHHQRDLESLGNYLIRRHQQAIAAVGMQRKAFCGDLPFRWQTDFDFPFFGGWKRNQHNQNKERNILVMIPGKNRREVVIMADHYDTAYMEDTYDKSGARLAAAGADDNHSATATLLQAAPIFLELAKRGRLERDIWLLHLTGEEFPADCMGARHFCESIVEKTLNLRLDDRRVIDLSPVQVKAVFVLDMIAHNKETARDIFQISPGSGIASLKLAWEAHLANLIWNSHVNEWNQRPERQSRGRAERCRDGITIPDIALHPELHSEIRTPDDPHSVLFNTDGQIFSDAGVPVVLFMENYDIDRTGYHDTKDTMEKIDLDYGAALAATAIETVARVSTSKRRERP